MRTSSTTKRAGIIGIAQAASYIATQVVTLVLVNWLTPADFGIFALCQVIVNLAVTVSTFGLEEAAIQSKGDPEDNITTAANLRLIIASIATFLVFISAQWLANLMGSPEAGMPLGVLSISFIISTLAFTPRVWIRKDLQFGKIAVATMAKAAIWATVALILAFLNFQYWALVFAFLAGALGNALVIYVLRPMRPKFRLNLSKVKPLLTFGAHTTGTGLLVFLSQNLDKIAIGMMVGMGGLGVYWIAYQYGTIPATFLTAVATTVLFPEYVILSRNVDDLRNKHNSVLRHLAILIYPIGIGMAAISPTFVTELFGTAWLSAIIPLSILSVFSILYSFNSTSGIIFISTSNSRQMLKQNVVMFIPFIVLLVPSIILFGMIGAALLFVGIQLVQFIWVTVSVGRILNYSIVRQLRQVHLIPAVSSLLMGLVIVAVWTVFGTTLYSLLIQMAVGIGVYTLILMVLTKGKIIRDLKHIWVAVLH